jgi:hypothetical protein
MKYHRLNSIGGISSLGLYLFRLFCCFLFFISIGPLTSFAQTNEDVTEYKYFDLIFISNANQGESGLEGGQKIKLENLMDSIVRNYKNVTSLVYYVCNGYKPDIQRSYSARSTWLIKLGEINSNTTAQYSIDQRMLLEDLWRNEKIEAAEINVYYFLQSQYLIDQFEGTFSDVSQFLNALPRNIAYLVGTSDANINVHFYLPTVTGQVRLEDIKLKLQTLNQFKNADESYLKTTLFFN